MNSKFKAKAVIFDRDGTIINTDGLLKASSREAFKRLGFKLEDEDAKRMIGVSFDVYKSYFLQKWDFDAGEFRKIQKELFYENLDQAEYFEDTLKLIKDLYSQNIPLAVTTSAGKEGTLIILENAGILNMFDAIVTKDDCKNFKPDPEPYILTASKLKMDPKDCVIIEDTALGVEAAKKAGMNCFAIPTEYTKDQDFSKADLVLNSAAEVLAYLDFQ